MSHSAIVLAEKHFSISAGRLLIGGIPVRELAEKYGTPLFAYQPDVMDRKLAALRAALPGQFSICYSAKANPNPTVVRHFLSRGCRLEIASGGEFFLGLHAGCDPDRMLFAGPGKTPRELELVLSHGIGEMHVESLTELERIRAICSRLGTRARVAVRVNPTGEAEGGAMRMGGKATPFGIDEEALDQVLDRIFRDPTFEFRGVHLFAGTQILDAQILVKQYGHGLDVARRAAALAGKPLHTVDFGGGLGIPYFAHENELDLEALRVGLAALFTEVECDARFAGTQFLVEPGRFLVGEAGIYVARVNDVKVSRGKKFLILDGGMNHHLAASGNLGQTIKRNYPIAILNKLDIPAAETVDVVGPLCTPLDTLARNTSLPHAEIGDLIGVFQSGAYARTASPLGFLSHPAPPEIWVEEGRDSLIRRRGEFADVFESAPLVESKR